MPWQEMVADVGGELDDDGVPAYREVVFTVPRQSGKTQLVLSWECQRAVGWEHLGPQVCAYTAQDGTAARKKLLTDQVPLLERHKRALGISRIYRGTGPFEGVLWQNGSRLGMLASTDDAGHGGTIDLAVKDEFWKDHDDRRDQSLRPAMITRLHAQVLTCTTMGTEESVPWNRLVERGRAAVESGKTNGIAYFEWSAPLDSDPDDPATWWGCMPALGFTVVESVIAGEREAMADNEFRRAFLNQQTKADDRVIPATLWADVCDPNVVASGDLVFALEANEDRLGGCVVACSRGELPVLEVVDHRRGNPSWLVERARELAASHPGAAFAVSPRGPMGPLLPSLERVGVRLVLVPPNELASASGRFFDAVVERQVRVRREPVLDAAVAAAVKRQTGESWVWGRRAQEDVSPLLAATVALWVSRSGGLEPFMVIT